jgi:putative sigma-54 modulation protein
MQIDISTRHGQITPATKEKISAKLEKLSRFQERLTAVNVIIDLSGDDSQVELRASVERTPDFVSRAKGPTLMGAVDGALQKMQEQMRRHKDKLVGHKSTGRRTEVPPSDEQQEPE